MYSVIVFFDTLMLGLTDALCLIRILKAYYRTVNAHKDNKHMMAHVRRNRPVQC